MDPYPIPPTPGIPGPRRRPNRWYNNWKILVPVVLGGLFVCVGLFVFGLMSLVYSMFRNSYPYQAAVESANHSAQVSAAIGTPIHVGWLASGSVNYNNSDGEANLSIPISGPKGHAHILVAGKKRANRWTFQTFEVDVDGQSTPIELPNPAPAPAPAGPSAPPSPATPGTPPPSSPNTSPGPV